MPGRLLPKDGPKNPVLRNPILSKRDEALFTVVFLVSSAIKPAPRLCWLLSGGIVANINQPKSVGHSFSIIEMKQRSATT